MDVLYCTTKLAGSSTSAKPGWIDLVVLAKAKE
jgi:hypothetical protein